MSTRHHYYRYQRVFARGLAPREKVRKRKEVKKKNIIQRLSLCLMSTQHCRKQCVAFAKHSNVPKLLHVEKFKMHRCHKKPILTYNFLF